MATCQREFEWAAACRVVRLDEHRHQCQPLLRPTAKRVVELPWGDAIRSREGRGRHPARIEIFEEFVNAQRRHSRLGIRGVVHPQIVGASPGRNQVAASDRYTSKHLLGIQNAIVLRTTNAGAESAIGKVQALKR